MTTIIFPAAFALIIVVLLGGPVTGSLRRLRVGQVVREDGPESHLEKADTPTMGGILIIFAALAATVAFVPDVMQLWPLLSAMVGFGLIGLLDDVSKLVADRSLGLKARHKLVLQIAVSALVGYVAMQTVGTDLHVPFAAAPLTLPPWLYVLLAVGTFSGTVNAVNLTDGVDGLAAGATAVSSLTMAVIAFQLGFPAVAALAAAVGGACLGFSWFNAYPAHVFMGDTGSMALGGALAAIALFTRTPLLLVIVGGLYVIVTLSVIIQVTYFRLTRGRRLFKMSPLHHHFELSGWSEPQVVTRFVLVALVFAALGLLAL